MSGIRSVLSAAVISLLVLSGCSEEEPVVDGQAAPAPPATEQQAPGENDASTEDAMETLRDAANSAIEGAGELAESARQAADEAIENAGPALERAGELAGQFKESVDEIVAQAADDLARATAALEERIAESTGESTPATGNPDAILPPAENLRADTRAAARAGPAGVGPDYVGVWAADAASCARIDQEAVEVFAVITPTTIRRDESVCNVEEAPLADGAVTLDGVCIAEGMEEERQISLNMASPDALSIAYGEAAGGADLVRCHLPE